MEIIKINEIIIPKTFKNTRPGKAKLNMIKEYLIENGKFDKPVVLNGKLLKDGYARYVVAKECGIEEVPYIDEAKYDKVLIGKFNNKGKEYIWKIPKGLKIEIGNKVLVENRDKVNVVDVLRMEDLTDIEMLKHKSVIKRLKNS